jgi:hypothetical protein
LSKRWSGVTMTRLISTPRSKNGQNVLARVGESMVIV